MNYNQDISKESKSISRRKFIGIAGAGAITVGSLVLFPELAHGTSSTELKLEADALESTAEDVESEMEEILARLAELEEEYNATLERYNKAQVNYAAALIAIDEAEEKVKVAEAKVASCQKQLAKNSLIEYREGSVSITDVLFGDNSVSSNSLSNNKKISDEEVTYIEEKKAAKAAADEAYKEYAKQEKIAAEELQTSLEAKEELETLQEELQAQYDSLSDELVELISTAEEVRASAEEVAALESAAKTAVTSVSGVSTESWINPAVGKYITSAFGRRTDPFDSTTTSYHYGVDLSCSYEPVYAMADGVCTYSGWRGTGGKTIILNHGNGIVSWYLHNSELNVSVGDEVIAGQQISVSGNTGRSTGPHLHFQINLNSSDGITGTAVNPTTYFKW